MKFITEDDLRTIYKSNPFTSYEIETGTRLTPGARQFLQEAMQTGRMRQEPELQALTGPAFLWAPRRSMSISGER